MGNGGESKCAVSVNNLRHMALIDCPTSRLLTEASLIDTGTLTRAAHYLRMISPFGPMIRAPGGLSFFRNVGRRWSLVSLSEASRRSTGTTFSIVCCMAYEPLIVAIDWSRSASGDS
jgi:hypothetical protein